MCCGWLHSLIMCCQTQSKVSGKPHSKKQAIFCIWWEALQDCCAGYVKLISVSSIEGQWDSTELMPIQSPRQNQRGVRPRYGEAQIMQGITKKELGPSLCFSGGPQSSHVMAECTAFDSARIHSKGFKGGLSFVWLTSVCHPATAT